MNVALEGAHRLTAADAARCACLAIAFSLISTAAFAQSGNSGFDIRQTERRFDAQQREQQRPGGASLMPANPNAGGARSTSEQKKLFVLRGVRLSGAHALPQDALANSYRDYLDKSISEADLARIADGITDQYRAAGYHLSRAIVPPQDIAGGRVKIRVIEGSITDVVIHGDHDGRFALQSFAKPILAARPSRQDVLERQLLLISARPGVQVTDTALDEIGVATGSFRLVVHVRTWQAYAASGIDNLGSSSVGPWQSYATAAFHSYLIAGDAAVVNLSTTPADRRQLGFARMAYDVPVGPDGISVGATALYSEVRPGDWRSEFNDITKTRSFEFRGRVNPIQSQNLSMFFTTALTFMNVSEKDVLGEIYDDRLRILSLISDTQFKDRFDGNNYLTLSLRQGLGGLGASQYGDAFLSRYNASGDRGWSALRRPPGSRRRPRPPSGPARSRRGR